MPRQARTIFALNRGVVSKLALARVDLERVALSAEIQKNWMSNTLGSMTIRPGFEYMLSTPGDERSKTIPYLFSATDKAELELTENALRVLIDDEPIARVAVSAAVTNGTFAADLSGWTEANEGSADCDHVVVAGAGAVALQGTGSSAAILRQEVTVSNVDVEHALRVVVLRGPVEFCVGSAEGLDDYVTLSFLGTGSHSLAFTPSGNFHISIFNRRSFSVLVDSVTVEAAGEMSLPTPWTEDEFPLLRTQQNNEVVYVADRTHCQQKIERRAARSWSVVNYEPETGPFRALNSSAITIAPSAIQGDVTLTASANFFKPTHVGALIRHQSTGQTVTESINAQDVFSDPIRVMGVGGARTFAIQISGTFTATVTLQYSVGEPGNWVDASSWTTETSESYADGFDNQEVYYRIGVKTGGFSAGPVVVTLLYTSGSITGIARIVSYETPTSVTAVVLQDFGSTTASIDWWEGAWSDRRGWPSAVVIVESRDTWGGKGGVWLGITDFPEDFDDTFEGDAGPIARSIRDGAFDVVPWMLALDQLVIGSIKSSADITALRIDGESPFTARSSSFDEPLTPSNFNIKTSSPEGACVSTCRTRLLMLRYNLQQNGYVPDDMNVANPDFNAGAKAIAQIAVQYKPDKRMHCRRDDGSVGVLVFDKAENLVCWLEVETDGFVEDISILPSAVEDEVRYVVRRTVNGMTKRFREKWALAADCTGFPVAALSDAHVRFTSATETRVITGLDHLEGSEVVAWGWNTIHPYTNDDDQVTGIDLGTYTVVDGQITVTQNITDACAGLEYEARWKSAKQAFAAAMGTALNKRKKIDHIGIIASNFHARGIQYGTSFEDEDLNDMPLDEQADEVSENHVWEDYDEPMIEFEGEWKSDARVCLRGASPRPATILAIGIEMQTSG